MRSCSQALLRGVRDVHELDAQGLAVGALQDGDDLADRGELESEYVIDEDLAIVVGFGEPVGAGIELFVIFRRLKTKRVELGVKVPADPVRADQHEGAYRVPGGLLHVGRRDLDAFDLRFSLDLVADRLLDLGPVAVERGHEFAARRHRPV